MTSKVTFDINAWTYVDYNDFVQALNDNDLDLAGELVTQIIIAWTYNKPLSKQGNALSVLGFAEGAEVLRAVRDTIGSFVKTLDTSDVACDLAKWSFGDFSELQKALKKGDAVFVAEKLRQVCSIPTNNGLPNDDGNADNHDLPLSAVNGVKFAKVVGELSGKVFQGKR